VKTLGRTPSYINVCPTFYFFSATAIHVENAPTCLITSDHLGYADSNLKSSARTPRSQLLIPRSKLEMYKLLSTNTLLWQVSRLLDRTCTLSNKWHRIFDVVNTVSRETQNSRNSRTAFGSLSQSIDDERRSRSEPSNRSFYVTRGQSS